MKNFADLMGKAKEAQERFKKMQETVAKTEVEGVSGGGMVKILMNCKGEIKKIDIDDSLMAQTEKTVLEDLLIAAFNDARHKSEDVYARELDDIKGSMNLPF